MEEGIRPWTSEIQFGTLASRRVYEVDERQDLAHARPVDERQDPTAAGGSPRPGRSLGAGRRWVMSSTTGIPPVSRRLRQYH
jgi:hypothetical protein